MRLERMLEAAADDLSDYLALNGNAPAHAPAHADLDLDFKLELDHISSAAERRLAESVSQELDYWEKLVFSFDMERDPGGPSQSESGSNTRGETNKRGERGPQPSNVSSMSSERSTSSSSSSQRHGQQPMESRHVPNPPFPPLFPTGQGQAPNRPLSHFSPALAGLDPYTLAHLAALSALQQGQQSHSAQSPNPADPATVLRQLQELLSSYAGADQRAAGPANSSGFAQGFSPLQPQTSSSRIPSGGSGHNDAQQSAQPSWPPHLQSSFPFPVPPINPSLAGQLSQLSPLLLPSMYPQPTQTPGVGPSSGTSRARSRSTASIESLSSLASPSDPRVRSVMDQAEISEDKRRRNTLASARFRIKKKHKTLALERSVVELEVRADDLEREASELRKENGWLKEMLIMKGRSIRAQAAAISQEFEQKEDEEEEEASAGEHEEDRHGDEKDPEDASDRKGKGKEKAN